MADTGSAPATATGAHGAEVDPRSSRSRKALAAGVVGLMALGAAGVFAVAQFTDGDEGGAESPAALGEAVMESLEREDVLGVIDLLLPGERETFREPMISLVSELSRLEVLSDDASLGGLQGLDLVLEERQVQVATTNVDDIANITMTALVTASIDGDQLPVGDLLTENFGDDMALEEVSETETGLEFELPVTAVERDGRWYMSGFYTAAEAARSRADLGPIPATGLAPAGGESPEGAIDALLAGVEQLDLAAVVAALDPNEAEALQRYAPLFLADAQRELDASPLTWTVGEVAYGVEGSGSTRTVTIDRLRLDGTVAADPEFDRPEQNFSVEVEGSCATVEADGEVFESCTPGNPQSLDDVFADVEGYDELRADLESILDDYEVPGITVSEVDGAWYVSPIATGFDQLLTFLGALDREELEQAADAFGAFTADLGSQFDVTAIPELGSQDTVTETVPVDDAASTDADRAYNECLALPTAVEVAGCLEAGVADGILPAAYLPPELEFLECGVADAYIGLVDLYAMSDAEYSALLETANSCFIGLVAAGRIEESAVPPEYLRLECAEGRNPWSFEAPDADEFFDRWLDCIYA